MKFLPFAAACMDLKIIMLSEISQTKKDKYCLLSLIYGIQKHNINEYDKKKETDSQILRTNQWLPAGRGKGGGAI